MLLIIELAFFGFGIYAIITGKMPSFLFGGGKYKAEGTTVRLLGLLLLTPLPVAFLIGMVIVLLNLNEPTTFAALFEFLFVMIISLIGSSVYKRIRVPTVQIDNLNKDQLDSHIIEEKIQIKSNAAIIYTITGIFGIVSIIVCPLAILYATQALKLIKEHHVGEEHLKKAIYSRAFAILILIIYSCIIALYLSIFLGR
jgi:hypothetical protein